MKQLNWFLQLKNMSKTDETAKSLLEAVQNATDDTKEQAKAEAKAYVESFHIEPESEVEIAEQELSETPAEEITATETPEIEIETETPDETGDRPEPVVPVDEKLVEKIRKRQKIAEENAIKRRNQPITLKEQKAAAIEKGKEVIKRNTEMAERRKALRAQIETQIEERRKQDAKNMVGVQAILLRELKLNKRLEWICKEHNITRKDLETLKANNEYGWAQCLIARPKLNKELELFIR